MIARPCLAAALCLALLPVAHAGQVALPRTEMTRLVEAYLLIKNQYVDQVDDKKLFTHAISGMLASLDPHSQYLDKDALADFTKGQSADYVGVGMEVSVDQGRIVVMELAEGGPAQRSGMRAGDFIESIEGVAVAGRQMDDVSHRMRGAPGSVVTVGVSRPGSKDHRTLSMARAEVHNTTVRSSLVAPGLGWVRISSFGEATAVDLSRALHELDDRGPLRGLILDLRNDPGGLVAAAVAVSSAFLAPGTEVFTMRGNGAGGESTHHFTALDDRAPAWAQSTPLMVMVNGASASSAELVAGALQDHRRATVVGSRTFGKGSIQALMPLSHDAAIKMTVARYTTPHGREIQGVGITPDVLVGPSNGSQCTDESARFGTGRDAALQVAVSILDPGQSGNVLARFVGNLGRFVRQLTVEPGRGC